MTAIALAVLAKFWPVILAAGAVIAAYFKGRSDKGKSAALDQKAKEADAYAKHIKDVEDAAYARDHVSGGMQSDPRNRDNS